MLEGERSSGYLKLVCVVAALAFTGSSFAIPPRAGDAAPRADVLARSTDVPATPVELPGQVCGNSALLAGPATPPRGATVVPAGDNSKIDFGIPRTTYWFASGVHTLGTDEYSQIEPGDGSSFIGAPGAVLDGQGLNNYAFTQHATGVTIEYLTVRGFVAPRDEGVVNHDSGSHWTVQFNTIKNNKGAGLFLGSHNVARYNCLAGNGQYGFSAYSGDGPLTDIQLIGNEITGNNTDDWESKVDGCGCTGGGKFWKAQDVVIKWNYVHDNHGPGIWADTNDNGFDVENNTIVDNDGVGFFYEISYNALIRNNTFARNGWVEGPSNSGFPTGAIYLSESGGDKRAANAFGYGTIEIVSNRFVDNWSGVVLWENADRFCGSPANTSDEACTLVNPAAATLGNCVKGTINREPYYSDCRWKTQNVLIHHNVFSMNKAAIPGCSAHPDDCGLQGVFSNYGTYPDWSPYQEYLVADAMVSAQNNLFQDNDYCGDWHFMTHDQGQVVDFDSWRALPPRQDAGSVMRAACATAWNHPDNPPVPPAIGPSQDEASPAAAIKTKTAFRTSRRVWRGSGLSPMTRRPRNGSASNSLRLVFVVIFPSVDQAVNIATAHAFLWSVRYPLASLYESFKAAIVLHQHKVPVLGKRP